MNEYQQFRNKLKYSGLTRTEISNLWKQRKLGKLELRSSNTNLKITTKCNTCVNHSFKKATKKNNEILYLTNIPMRILRTMTTSDLKYVLQIAKNGIKACQLCVNVCNYRLGQVLCPSKVIRFVRLRLTSDIRTVKMLERALKLRSEKVWKEFLKLPKVPVS